MSKYSSLMTNTPQSEPLDERQVQNNAGGYVYALDMWRRLERFLILGSDSQTYYQTAQQLTRQNAGVIEQCWGADPGRTAMQIASVSGEGRAPKNDAAIFALAIGACHKDVAARQKALSAMPFVCRTSTHLFQFVDNCRALGRGWGRALKSAVAKWYDEKPVEALAYQVIKYRARENYTHKRLLQTAHPKGNDNDQPERSALYRWVCEKDYHEIWLPAQIKAHIKAMTPGLNHKDLIALITEHHLPWEAIPTEAKTNAAVWNAMLPSMGMTALIRNLGTMTRLETLKPLDANVKFVCDKVQDRAALQQGRIHPFQILMARTVYAAGKGVAGSKFRSSDAQAWAPIGMIVEALDKGFYEAFKLIEPTNKRTLVALDVSDSMRSAFIGSSLSAREASAALAMVTMRSESNWHCVGFTSGLNGAWVNKGHQRYGRDEDGISPLPLSPGQSLGDVVGALRDLPFGGTDCALPMLYALDRGLKVDTFIIYTDNETWAGTVHPSTALKEYRQKTGIPAKLVVVGMTSTGFSIADPNDAGMLDVVGFDSSCPSLIAEFARN